MAQFTNQASVTYNGITVNSNIVTGEITQVITAFKRSTVSEYQTGDILTYVVGIQNSGTTDFNGLTITDNLGENAFGTVTVTPLTFTGDPILYIVNGALQPAPTVTAGPPLVISGINVPAGGNAEVIYRVRVNEFANPEIGGTINNTASIIGGGIAETVTATETVNANEDAVLSIFKELTPTTVVENGQITYTFTIQNTGASAITADDLTVIEDIFNPTLDAPITVTLDGAVLPETGNYTYDPVSGRFATVAGAVTVPAATYTQDAATGAWTVTPGVTIITVTGTI